MSMKHIVFVLLFGVFASSCGNQPDDRGKQDKGKVYKGTLHVSADLSLEPVLKQIFEMFQFHNDSIDLFTDYKNEQDIIGGFRSGTTNVMVLTRDLTDAEVSSLRIKDTIYVRQVQVAYDAVALIGAKEGKNNTLDLEELARIFQSGDKSRVLVFDKNIQSVVDFVVAKLNIRNSDQVYGVDGVEKVIDYVSENRNAIGFLPFGCVSDPEDPLVLNRLKKVNILSLRHRGEDGDTITAAACQSDIASGDYPLIRKVNVVARFKYSDNPEWLLTNFMYKEKGGRIFLKAGYVPFKAPEREIVVHTNGLKSN